MHGVGSRAPDPPPTRASPLGTSDPLLTASPADPLPSPDDPLPQNETRVEVTTQGSLLSEGGVCLTKVNLISEHTRFWPGILGFQLLR